MNIIIKTQSGIAIPYSVSMDSSTENIILTIEESNLNHNIPNSAYIADLKRKKDQLLDSYTQMEQKRLEDSISGNEIDKYPIFKKISPLLRGKLSTTDITIGVFLNAYQTEMQKALQRKEGCTSCQKNIIINKYATAIRNYIKNLTKDQIDELDKNIKPISNNE